MREKTSAPKCHYEPTLGDMNGSSTWKCIPIYQSKVAYEFQRGPDFQGNCSAAAAAKGSALGAAQGQALRVLAPAPRCACGAPKKLLCNFPRPLRLAHP